MALDSRAKKLAQIVVDYSLEINPQDTLLIQSEYPFAEFAEKIKETAESRKAKAILELRNLQEGRALIERNNLQELEAESERLCSLAEMSTARAVVSASSDRNYLEGVDPKKIKDFYKIIGEPFLKRINKLKWNVVAYPCESDAEGANMSLEEYNNFLFSATNIDWIQTREKMKIIKDMFDGAKDVHIITKPHTDIHLSLKGRGGQICDGKFNLPDGEVFYGPVEDSANGTVYFPYPSVEEGNRVKGIRLKYQNGEIVAFSAEENQSFLEEMLKDPGAKRIGEFGIGTNYGIKNYIQNALFDEKIGGTIHLAIGSSYTEDPLDNGGGLNEADMHWDLVCDLRENAYTKGGEIFVDGKLVQKNGVWSFE